MYTLVSTRFEFQGNFFNLVTYLSREKTRGRRQNHNHNPQPTTTNTTYYHNHGSRLDNMVSQMAIRSPCATPPGPFETAFDALLNGPRRVAHGDRVAICETIIQAHRPRTCTSHGHSK